MEVLAVTEKRGSMYRALLSVVDAMVLLWAAAAAFCARLESMEVKLVLGLGRVGLRWCWLRMDCWALELLRLRPGADGVRRRVLVVRSEDWECGARLINFLRSVGW